VKCSGEFQPSIARQIDSIFDEWTAVAIMVDLDVAAGNGVQAAATASETDAPLNMRPPV
jgi:hypothetical protein